MLHKYYLPFTALILFLVLPIEARIGILTQFAEIPIENLEIGKSYNITKLIKVPYTVINAGDTKMDVKTVVEIPRKKQLMKGYEAIQDKNWIKIVPDIISVVARGNVPADVIITIPNDVRFANKHYQAMLYSYSIGSGMFSAGVRFRLTFSIREYTRMQGNANIRE